VLALLLVGHAIAFLLLYDTNVGQMVGTICLRVGLTLGAIWLAFPQIVAITSKWPPRLILAIAVGAVIVIARPKTFPIVLVVVAIVGAMEVFGWLLKPPPEKTPRSKRTAKR
jgi:hypothetical protein